MKDKLRKIEERLQLAEQHLANAEEYIRRGVNVEGSSFFHFGDWQGKSGHPLWMKNHMIPTVLKWCAKKEKALARIVSRAKDRKLAKRRRTRIISLPRTEAGNY